MQNVGYNEFGAYQSNYSLPQSGGDSASVTTGASANVMGAWTDVFGGLVNEDSYGLYMRMFSGETAGTATPYLVDIGVDAAGGTSYSVLIPSLLGMGWGDLGFTAWRCGIYYFPIFIPKGARVGARGQTSASQRSFSIRARLAQKPSRPDLVRCGTFVDVIGAVPASSLGTNYTPGLNTWGAWTSLGNAPREGFWVAPSFCNDVGSMVNNVYGVDIAVGDTTAKRTLLPDIKCGHQNSPMTTWDMPIDQECFAHIPAGTDFFVRGFDSNTPVANYNAVVHVVGGN